MTHLRPMKPSRLLPPAASTPAATAAVTAITAACLLACLASPAWAQSQEVLVIGSARAQRGLDSPFAISAVDASDLRNAGPMVNLSEALAQVPGLVVNNRNNYAQDLQINSRGFGARAAFGVRGMRLYSDGIPATMPDGQGQAGHFDLAGAQRIEVLRGPFSALYGNSSGGVIALFTAPVTSGLAELAVDGGSFGLQQARLGLASPLGQVLGGALTVRANVSGFEIDGFRPQSAANRQLGNLQLGWDTGSDKLIFQYSDQRQDAQDPLGLTRAQFDADPRQTTSQAIPFNPATPTQLQYDTRKTIRQNQAGVNWRHEFGDAGVLRESQLAVYSGSRGVTQWQAIAPVTQVNPANPNAKKQGGGVVDFDRAYSGVEGKLTLQLGAADLVAGLNFETQEDDRRGYENFTGPVAAPTALGITGKLRRDETNRATTREAFTQARLPLAPGWELTGGLRGGQVKMSTSDRYVDGVNGDDSGDLGFSYLNPALGLRWAPSPDWALHASAARGFESPTLGELAYSPGGAGGFNSSLKGQSSRQVELGAKWRRSSLDLDVVVFNADTENEIGVLSNVGGRSVFQNVGRTRRSGAELASTWRPLPGLRLRSALTWLDASYRDDFFTCTATPCPSANVKVAAGNRIAGTQSSSAWAEAAWRPGLLPGEVAVEWRAVSSAMANDLNTARAAGYALMHLRWSGSVPLAAQDSIEWLARLDNVLDRSYVGSVIVNDGNSRFFETGSPRAGLLSVRWLHRW
jgi:iron complex outermembrane receptor protein